MLNIVTKAQVKNTKKKINSLRNEAHSLVEIKRYKKERAVYCNTVSDVAKRKSDKLFQNACKIEDHWYAAIWPEEFSSDEMQEARDGGFPVLS